MVVDVVCVCACGVCVLTQCVFGYVVYVLNIACLQI